MTPRPFAKKLGMESSIFKVDREHEGRFVTSNQFTEDRKKTLEVA